MNNSKNLYFVPSASDVIVWSNLPPAPISGPGYEGNIYERRRAIGNGYVITDEVRSLLVDAELYQSLVDLRKPVHSDPFGALSLSGPGYSGAVVEWYRQDITFEGRALVMVSEVRAIRYTPEAYQRIRGAGLWVADRYDEAHPSPSSEDERLPVS